MVVIILGMIISLAAAVFTFWQAKTAKDTVKQANLMKLFTTFDIASHISIEKPELLFSVHGLDKNISTNEALSIAYLSSLIDGFQYYYDSEYNGDFSKMELELKGKSNFFNRILAVSDNRDRWEKMKKIYYGSFDNEFIKAVDNLIAFENAKKNK